MDKMIAFANEIIGELNTEEERLEEVESEAREEADRIRARAEKDGIRDAKMLIYGSLTREMQNELADMSKENERLRKNGQNMVESKKTETVIPRNETAQIPEPKSYTRKSTKSPRPLSELDIRNMTEAPEYR